MESIKIAGHDWSVVKTIEFGLNNLRTVASFRKTIAERKMHIDGWVDYIFGRPGFWKKFVVKDAPRIGKAFAFCAVSVEELGFSEGAKREDILTQAKAFGLQPCSFYLALKLRLSYTDQPRGEWLAIASEESFDKSGEDLGFLCLEHTDGGLFIDCCYDCPNHIWNNRDRFIFVVAL